MINKQIFNTIGKGVKTGCELVGCGILIILALGVAAITDEASVKFDDYTLKYSDVIKAITESDLWSHDKEHLIKELRTDGDPEFYKSVLAILDSDMWTYEKVKVIMNMNKKYS